MTKNNDGNEAQSRFTIQAIGSNFRESLKIYRAYAVAVDVPGPGAAKVGRDQPSRDKRRTSRLVPAPNSFGA